MERSERSRGSLLGLAAGHAPGRSAEFRPRGTLTPLTDMVGGVPFGLAPGQWTDDTSMALCLAESLVEQGGLDARDQMRRYCRWSDHGYLSSAGSCFDVGGTLADALRRFKRDGNPFAGSADPRSAGDGCIMRLAPVPICFAPDLDAAERFAADSARTTHGARECVDARRAAAVGARGRGRRRTAAFAVGPEARGSGGGRPGSPRALDPASARCPPWR